MGESVIIVNKERVETLIERLGDPANLNNAVEEVRRMLDAKHNMALQADRASCCTAGEGAGADISLFAAIDLLKRALDSLEEKDITEGIRLLREYADTLP